MLSGSRAAAALRVACVYVSDIYLYIAIIHTHTTFVLAVGVGSCVCVLRVSMCPFLYGCTGKSKETEYQYLLSRGRAAAALRIV